MEIKFRPERVAAAVCAAVFLSLCSVCAAEERNDSGLSAGNAAFMQGCGAFKAGDWNSAMILLRKASSYPENSTADTWYMLITSEMYAGEYKAVSADCDTFISRFARSIYLPYIQYQKGRALFYLGEYDKSVILLSGFCHQYPGNEMYASALFWIAESFYAGYNYDEARALYGRIVSEYPSDAKAPAAQYRIETIAQRTREEKLLYLLKKTGEEYLSAKEDYERQLKMYDAAASSGNGKKMADLQKRNNDLEAEIIVLKRQIAQLQSGSGGSADVPEASNAEEIARLKAKAKEAQQLLDQKESGGK